MGFWDRIKGQAGAQFLDVIQWLEQDQDTIVWRFPIYDQAITDQSKVIVREGQVAVFVSEGRLSEVFAPGTYTLDTANQPITAFFKTIAYAMNNPYKGDILFVSTKQFTNNGWGTQNPFMMRDQEFGPVRVRAFGNYSFRVTDPAAFIRQIVGTDGLFTREEITGQLKVKVTTSFISAIGAAGIPVLDLAANYQSVGDKVRDAMNPPFVEQYGISLTDFTVANISVPEEVEKALDTRSKMGILGNLDAYTKLKAADAIGDAAKNQGIGGMGAGMGVGLGVGQVMAGAMAGAMGSGTFDPQTGMKPAAPAPAAAPTFHYAGPSGQSQASADEIAAKVAADRAARHLVWATGWAQWKSWDEVPEIAGRVPPPLDVPPPVPSGPPPLPE